jgi:hypothetical protein
VPADGVPVHRPGAPERVFAAGGESRETGPAVVFIRLPFGQPGGGKLADDPAHPGPAEHRPLAKLAHPQPAAGGGVKLKQHVVPGQRHLARGPQLRFHRRHEPAVRDKQAAPRRDIGVFRHVTILSLACVRTHIYYLRTHAPI